MSKKLLAILGIVALTGYLFRDRLLAGALALGGKLDTFKEDLGWTEEEADEGPDFVWPDTAKES